MYLNVWFDGNRNGRWGERKPCVDQPAPDKPTDHAHEWIVQNFIVVVPNAATVQDIQVPTLKVLNNAPNAPAWVRFTLSEAPIQALAPFQHDGRGPQAPAAWELGETEDYYYEPPTSQGQPGEVVAEKGISPNISPATLGSVFTYTIYVEHVGGTAPINLNVVDTLPAEVIPVAAPSVSVINPTVTTLLLQYNPSSGPSGTVTWQGSLSPGAKLALNIPVKVRKCPPQGGPIVNRAQIFNADTNTLLSTVQHQLPVECQIMPPPVDLEKLVVVNGVVQHGEVEVGIEDEVGYELVLSSQNLSRPLTIVVTDTLPAGLSVERVISQGERRNGNVSIYCCLDIDGDGYGDDFLRTQILTWTVQLEPNHPQERLRFLVKPKPKLQCLDRLINIAYWQVLVNEQIIGDGQSQPAVIVLGCTDLGDAPDSTNHAGIAMSAYPSVTARFPTVFDPATGADQGPKHLINWPLFLGQGVTREREADIGSDADGVNNIRPAFDQPNLDKRDDGLDLTTLRFEDCRAATIPVIVTIQPAALTLLSSPNQKPMAYLNVWLDSNRNGAWVDRYQCAGADGLASTGWEHIVVDHPVDLAALGPGSHTLLVNTNWPVSWPAQLQGRPAWLRVSLSERPSNKVLNCSTPTSCTVGDGRGFAQPFRFGETEDYPYRQLQPGEQPTDGADVAVEKKGQLLQLWQEGGVPGAGWRAVWEITYRNNGSTLASDVWITDTLSGLQSYLFSFSHPPITPAVLGSTLVYTVGPLPPGATGTIVLHTSLPLTFTPGTLIPNEVTITADQDDDPSNNTQVVTLTVPLLSPLITDPIPGTTCTGTFTVTGQAQPGVNVDLSIVDANNSVVAGGVVTPDGSGHWSFSVSGLADGQYTIVAVAQLGSQISPASTVQVIVDSTLFWDPISIRFVDENGYVVRPLDSNGRLDSTGWQLFLRPLTQYTVTIRVCCEDPNAQVTLELGDTTIALTDPDGDHTYSATFTSPDRGEVQGAVRLCVLCDLIRICSDGQILIDPEGTVFDSLTGQPISGAQVACMVQTASSSAANYTLWPAADFDQANPQITGDDGYYSFFTPPGTYRIQVQKAGYQPHLSPDLVVVDTPVHYDVPLTPVIAEDADVQVLITEHGFEPSVLTVTPGTIVEFINATANLRGAMSISFTTSVASAMITGQSLEGFDSGLLAGGERYKHRFTAEGSYVYVDHENPLSSGAIIIQGAAQGYRIYLPTVSR